MTLVSGVSNTQCWENHAFIVVLVTESNALYCWEVALGVRYDDRSILVLIKRELVLVKRIWFLPGFTYCPHTVWSPSTWGGRRVACRFVAHSAWRELIVTEESLLFRCQKSHNAKVNRCRFHSVIKKWTVADTILSSFSLDCWCFLRRLSPVFGAMSPVTWKATTIGVALALWYRLHEVLAS